MEIKVELGETKTARRQSIEEEKVERKRWEDVEKQKTIYHKGKGKVEH